jgi:ABC-type uncharacterized transport system fused permease/ATPase subunit
MADKIELQQAVQERRLTALEKAIDTMKKDQRAAGDVNLKNLAPLDQLKALAARVDKLEQAIAALASTKKDVKSVEEQQRKSAEQQQKATLEMVNKIKADNEKMVTALNIDNRFRQLEVQVQTALALATAAQKMAKG